MKLLILILLCMLPGVAWADVTCTATGKPVPLDVKCPIAPINKDCPSDYPVKTILPSGNVKCDIGPDTSWHLLTVSHSGTVSLIKGLSKGECENVSGYLLGTISIKPGTYSKLSDAKSPENIDRAECFQ